MTVPRRKTEARRRSLPLSLVLLLAAWLGLAQTVAQAHDAVHYAHAHADLCDILSAPGKAPALVSGALSLSLPARPDAPTEIPLPSLTATASWPAFHSRAPPR